MTNRLQEYEYWQAQNSSIAEHPLVQALAIEEGAKLVPLKSQALPLGWGYKKSGMWAQRVGEQRGTGYCLLEDGFIRSVRPGTLLPGTVYSLVTDSSGIYYDPGGRTEVIEILNSSEKIGSKEMAQVVSDLNLFIESGASKYNCFSQETEMAELEELMPLESAQGKRNILLIDQTLGDSALSCAGIEASHFDAMLEQALKDHPHARIYIRSHPDAAFRGRKSCFSQSSWQYPRVKLCPSSFSPAQVFARVSQVYVMNSLLGLEAIVHGVETKCFGPAFYAGWGLSEDFDKRVKKRSKTLSREELFCGAYNRYSRFYDPVVLGGSEAPDRPRRCSLRKILEHVKRQKHVRAHTGQSILYRFPGWKADLVSEFMTTSLQCQEAKPPLRLKRSSRLLAELRSADDASVIVWGRTNLPEDVVLSLSDQKGRVVRVEDGFLRSVGLGLDFHRPLSLVFDRSGIYYDATSSSDLEQLIIDNDFSSEQLMEAEALCREIVSGGLSKYNLSSTADLAQRKDETANLAAEDWVAQEGAEKILITGQVENDASIAYGAFEISTNAALLKKVREDHPQASIVYKPHPDVTLGKRPGRVSNKEVLAWADYIVDRASIVPWLEAADRVAVITSLSGFEALMRGKKVSCYGAPFFAGWGLTDDRKEIPRRGLPRSLPVLTYAALIAYPRYLHPSSGEFISALDAVELLKSGAWKAHSRPAYLRAFAAAKRKWRGLFER